MVDKRGKSALVNITDYRWKDSRLQLRYLLATDETEWMGVQDAKMDHLQQTVRYILDKYKSQQRNPERDCVLQWAKKTMRDLEWAMHQTVRLYTFYLNNNEQVKKVRRVIWAKKKKQKSPDQQYLYMGLKSPGTSNMPCNWPNRIITPCGKTPWLWRSRC
eukprot:10046967-Ditylum_brightwellii.AAC.1